MFRLQADEKDDRSSCVPRHVDVGTYEMPAAARRVVLEVLRSASRDAFQVAFSFAARPPVSTMLKPTITKPLHHHDNN
jgi:hypothetical protein